MIDLKQIGDTYYAQAPNALIEFARLSDSRSSGLTAELTATELTGGRQHWSRLNLAAPRSRKDLADALCLACPGPEWSLILDAAVHAVVAAHRKGLPAEDITAEPPSEARWLIPSWMPAGETTVLFGDGGSSKSLTALALAFQALRPLRTSDTPWRRSLGTWLVSPLSSVLYLDWESHAADHKARWWGLCQGAGLANVPGLRYLPLVRSLADALPHVARLVAEHAVDLVIVDSLAPASGSEPEGADAATRTMMALRSLPCTRLVVAHVSKTAAEGDAPARPYGSVFVQNLARSTIECRSEDGPEPASKVVSFWHRKSNMGPLAKPSAIGYFWTDDGQVLMNKAEPDLSKAGLTDQILVALSRGQKTPSELAEETGAETNAVRATLSRLEKRNKVVRLSDVGAGRSKETSWGRIDTKRNE